MLIVGDTGGKVKQTWWKLCPKCYEHMYKKHVIPSIKVDKGQQKILGRDSTDIKLGLEKHSKFWKQW